MTSYYVNCIDDTERFDCMKNGLRFITAYKYKFKNLGSKTLTDRRKKVSWKFLLDKYILSKISLKHVCMTIYAH